MEKRITYPKTLPDLEYQSGRTHNHLKFLLGMTNFTLALIGILTVILYLHAKTEAHFYNQFTQQRTEQAHRRAQAQAQASALEALHEGQMETLPLVLKRTRNFINGK